MSNVNCGTCPSCLEAQRRGLSAFERQSTYHTKESLLCNVLLTRISSSTQAKSSVLENQLARLRRILVGHEVLCTTTGEFKERIQTAGKSFEEDYFYTREGKRIIYCIICSNEISVCACSEGYFGDAELEYAIAEGKIKDPREEENEK